MWWLVVPGSVAALSLTALNLATWPTGNWRHPVRQRVSVLIPARDEAQTIEACVRAANALPVFEIVVYDDGSTDGTSAILARLSQEIPRLRVIRGQPKPDGWVGKPHACHRLSHEARGDLYVFVDADTRLRLDALPRLVSLFEQHRADLVTAVPLQITGSPLEHLVLPLLMVTYTSWLPLFLVHRSRDPRFLAANGQVLAVRPGALDAIGGFASVAREVVDDMALCRRMKASGRRVVFADGRYIAKTRMYRSAAEVWSGFSKNIYEGLGSPLALAGVLLLYGLAFVAPYVALLAGLLGASAALVPGAVGVAANLGLRTMLAARFHHPAWSVLAHPIGVIVAGAIALNSWRWAHRGTITWRGRTYANRTERRLADVA